MYLSFRPFDFVNMSIVNKLKVEFPISMVFPPMAGDFGSFQYSSEVIFCKCTGNFG